MKWFLVLFATLAGPSCTAPAIGADDAPAKGTQADRVRAWREDLDFLAKTLKEKHWNVFFKVKKERFEESVADLRKQIPALKDHEIMVGFIKIAAMIGDSHTLIRRGGSSKFAFRRYPVSFAWCSDGLFVESAAKEHRSLLRAKVTDIGKFKLDEILKNSPCSMPPKTNRGGNGGRWIGLTRPKSLRCSAS